MDIKEMGLVELKALAYDQIALTETTQNNLRLINQEIQNRASQPIKQPEKASVDGQ